MVFVEYRGKCDKRYAFIYNLQDLKDCIAWLEKQREWMEKNGKNSDSVMEFSDEDTER